MILRVDDKPPSLDDPRVVAHTEWPDANEDDFYALGESLVNATGAISQQMFERVMQEGFLWRLNHTDADA